MEATNEPFRHNTSLTIYGDGQHRTGWMKSTEWMEPQPFFTIAAINGVVTSVYDERGRKHDFTWSLDGGLSIVIGCLRPPSKQTNAFLRVQRRESFTPHAHKRPVSTRRMAVYQRRREMEQATLDAYIQQYVMVSHMRRITLSDYTFYAFSTPTWQQSYYGGWIHL